MFQPAMAVFRGNDLSSVGGEYSQQIANLHDVRPSSQPVDRNDSYARDGFSAIQLTREPLGEHLRLSG